MISELSTPRQLDTLLVDGNLYALAFKFGRVGYSDAGTFIPLNTKDLFKAEKDRAGKPTWVLVRDGETPSVPLAPVVPIAAPVPTKVEVKGKGYVVGMNYVGETIPSRVIYGIDEKDVRNKAIRSFAAKSHLSFPLVFEYFNTHPQSIKVEEL